MFLLPIGYQNRPMKPFRALSAVEQLAAHLREQVLEGKVDGHMPGVASLVGQLRVGTKTVVAALGMLRREGILEPAGMRRRNRIVTAAVAPKEILRVGVLLYEKSDLRDEHTLDLQRKLEERGHSILIPPKTLTGLRFDVGRVARIVEGSPADAWVIRAGPRAVLEWFAARPAPCFAMFGRQGGLPMAGLVTLKSPAVAEALRELTALGHRRIVMLTREERRKPSPGLLERSFLDELEKLGIETGPYNLPSWTDDARAFHRCLDSLFRHTPPTALLLSESALFFATQQYLLGKGLRVPRDVSLVSLDDHPAFSWFDPEVARIHTDTGKWVPRVVQWVENTARGRTDQRQTQVPAVFIRGGTIGPATR